MTTSNILSQLGSPGVSTGMKNRIINGAMVIDQRNAGASVTPGDSNYTLDRWQARLSQSSKFSVQQTTTAPAGFNNSLKVTSLSAYSVAAGDYFFVNQQIEGFNCADLGWGTANAKTVTLSFQVYSSLTGTFGGSLRTGSGTAYSYPFSYSIPVANTWTSISVTVAGPTSTWAASTTNGSGIEVDFALGVGSTFSGTAGSWSANTYISATGATSVVGTNGATFYITGIQLEVGTTATNFDFRSYGTELYLCERYFQVFDGFVNAADSSTAINVTFPFRTDMRASPSVSCTTLAVTRPGVADYTQSSPVISIVGGVRVSIRGIQTQASNFSGLTQGVVYQHNVSGSILLSAEL